MLYELCAVTSVEEFPMFMLEEELGSRSQDPACKITNVTR